jgi:DNA-binding winged helix-turn-helix (wHTH) protein
LPILARTLLHGDVPVRLGRRAFDVLATLAATQGETVTKGALMDLVWPGLTVEEKNLHVQIVALRKVLGTGWTANVQGAGYRLETAPTRGQAEALECKANDKPSIAVVPFMNISSDMADEFIADGMVEDVNTQLSRSRALLVIARASTLTYKGREVDLRQVGRELRVR